MRRLTASIGLIITSLLYLGTGAHAADTGPSPILATHNGRIYIVESEARMEAGCLSIRIEYLSEGEVVEELSTKLWDTQQEPLIHIGTVPQDGQESPGGDTLIKLPISIDISSFTAISRDNSLTTQTGTAQEPLDTLRELSTRFETAGLVFHLMHTGADSARITVAHCLYPPCQVVFSATFLPDVIDLAPLESKKVSHESVVLEPGTPGQPVKPVLPIFSGYTPFEHPRPGLIPVDSSYYHPGPMEAEE